VAGKVKTAVKTELSFLAADRLVAWLEALASGETQVLVPSRPDGTFVPWQGDEPDLGDRRPPRVLMLQRGPAWATSIRTARSVTPVVDGPTRRLRGLCDMRPLHRPGVRRDRASGGDPNSLARRARATFISVACGCDVGSACFCATFFSRFVRRRRVVVHGRRQYLLAR
jgi:hypothetical protein